MNKVNRAPAMFTISTLEELIRHLAGADPNYIFVVCAQVLNQWAASLEIIPPPPSVTPRGNWKRPNWVLDHYPIGATKLNTMLASREVVSKLVGGCRWIYVPSLEAVGDPHARLKRGRPPKSTAAEPVDLSPAPAPPVPPLQGRRPGRPRRPGARNYSNPSSETGAK
jgi:hypothetical protein